MTLNIKDGCYVRLRGGVICGPVRPGDDRVRPWRIPDIMSWTADGTYSVNGGRSRDIIEVLPGKPVFIDTPFEVGKRYRSGNGIVHRVEGYALRLGDNYIRFLDGRVLSADGDVTVYDLIPGAIEDEEQVTVTMSKVDYERAMELLGKAIDTGDREG